MLEIIVTFHHVITTSKLEMLPKPCLTEINLSLSGELQECECVQQRNNRPVTILHQRHLHHLQISATTLLYNPRSSTVL